MPHVQRPQRVNHDTHIHTPLNGIAQCAQYGVAGWIIFKDVIGQIKRVFRMLDHPQLGCQ